MTKWAKQQIEALLRTSLAGMGRARTRTEARNCPDDESLAAYLDGNLAGKTFRQVEHHLKSCADCAELAIRAALAAGARRARADRWRLAANFLVWLTGAAAISFVAVALALSLAASTLIDKAQRSLGGNLAVENVSLGIADGPAIRLQGIRLAWERADIPVSTVDLASVRFDLGRLVKGERAIAELALIRPEVTLTGALGLGDSARDEHASLDENFIGRKIARLLPLAPMIRIVAGSIHYRGSGLAEGTEVTIGAIEALVSARTVEERSFDLRASIGAGALSAHGTVAGLSRGSMRWHGKLTLGPVAAPQVLAGLMGVESGILDLEALFQGGEAPGYAIGHVDIRQGTLAGWGILDAMMRGRNVPPDLAALAGMAPLAFDRATYQWHLSGAGPAAVSFTIEGRELSLQGEFKVSRQGRLAGEGSLDLGPSLGERLRKILPASEETSTRAHPRRLPLRIAGTLKAPSVRVSGQ